MIPCNEQGSITELMFGHPAVLGAVIESDRPLEFIQLSLRQLGWSVNAPLIEQPAWVSSNDACLQQEGDVQRSFLVFGSFERQYLVACIDEGDRSIPCELRFPTPVFDEATCLEPLATRPDMIC